MQGVYNFLGYNIQAQLKLLLYALILGAALGAVFDLFRVTRVFASYSSVEREVRPKWSMYVLCFIEDITFGAIAAVALVLFCFKANGGASRGYILFGALVGFTVYLLSIGRLTSRISKSLAILFYRILAFTKTRIILPTVVKFKKVFRRIYRITLGRAVEFISHRIHILRTKKTSRELLAAISRLYIKRKDNGDETVSHANAGEARRVRSLHNIDSHPRISADRI